MSVVQLGNGSYNTNTGHYTTYDPRSGQITTKFIQFPQGANFDQVMQGIQNGSIDINSLARNSDSNFLGGRSNVNISGQIQRAADAIMQKYQGMDWATANQFAQQWVTDRISKGHDANEIEDFAKGAFRDDKILGDEMLKGIDDMVVRKNMEARKGGDTSTSLGQDPRQSIQDELREFAGRMMQTVGPDSPQAKRIAELAAAAGNKYATSSGMGPGGLTTRGVATTAARAHTDLQTQREGIGAQALAAAGNQQLSVDQLNTQLQAQNQQAGALNASGIGGLIGSGLGLVGGVIGTAYSGGSMAPAIPGLMAAGGAAGQAVGGIAGNSGPPITYGGGVSSNASKPKYIGGNGGTS